MRPAAGREREASRSLRRTRVPLTFTANYGRGINSIDARGVVQRPDQPRLATTDFYQLGTSSNFGRFAIATDAFLIDHSNEQVYIPDDGSFEFKGPSRAYGYEAKASVAITRRLSLNGGLTKIGECILPGRRPSGLRGQRAAFRGQRGPDSGRMARLERLAADARDQPLPAGRRGSFDCRLGPHGVRFGPGQAGPPRRGIQSQPGQPDQPGLLRNAELLRLACYAVGSHRGEDSRHAGIPAYRRRRSDFPAAGKMTCHGTCSGKPTSRTCYPDLFMRRILPAAAAALLMAGCGYIGGPLPPLANVPSRVTDLAAVQRDSRIIVQFTVPRLTTEGMAIRKPLKLDLRIGTAGAPFNAEEWAAQAQPVREGPVSGGIARYEIPSAEWTGKEAIIAVRAIGANGKESGWSNYVVVPVVPPPDKPANMSRRGDRAGRPPLLDRAREPFSRPPPRSAEREFYPVADVRENQWTDPGAEFGKPTPTSYRPWWIWPTTNWPKAISPRRSPSPRWTHSRPPRPSACAPPSAPNSVELAWDRNTEPDLAGYRVYRSTAGGEFARIADISADSQLLRPAVEPGKSYRYAVSAFDRPATKAPAPGVVEVAVPYRSARPTPLKCGAPNGTQPQD